MKASIEGAQLVIRIDLEEAPYRATGSGKNLVVATTRGEADAGCSLNGKPVSAIVTAYIPTM